MTDFDTQLVPQRSAFVNCGECVLRHFSHLCTQMICVDGDYHHVYWTLRHGTAWDVPPIFRNAYANGVNIRAMCLKKIAQEYSR